MECRNHTEGVLDVVIVLIINFLRTKIAMTAPFCLPRTIRTWDLMPSKLVKAPTLQSFKLAAVPAITFLQTVAI